MSTAALLSNELRDFYIGESARIEREFLAGGDGKVAIAARAKLLDHILIRLWEKWLAPEAGGSANLALVALGGYGRNSLFPYSDIDLLFLHADRAAEDQLRDRVRGFSQEI